jgi:hypothetical protein
LVLGHGKGLRNHHLLLLWLLQRHGLGVADVCQARPILACLTLRLSALVLALPAIHCLHACL